jgi:hypothetical protein
LGPRPAVSNWKQSFRIAKAPPNGFLSPFLCSSDVTFPPQAAWSSPLIDICLPTIDKRQAVFVERRSTKVKGLAINTVCVRHAGVRSALSGRNVAKIQKLAGRQPLDRMRR